MTDETSCKINVSLKPHRCNYDFKTGYYRKQTVPLCSVSASNPLMASDGAEPGEEGVEDATLPCTEDVICKTEQITKNIQELLRAAQETKHER